MEAAAQPGLREQGKQRRVEQILAAARALLREAETGGEPGPAPSVERIAERAGVSPATVFNLVGPRDAIWAALADTGLVELGARLPAPGVLEPHEHARAVVDQTIQGLLADAPVYRALLSQWHRSARLMRQAPARPLTDTLRRAAEAGQVRGDADLHEAAQVITAATAGFMHQWAAGLISDEVLAQRCRAAVDLGFAALR